MVIRDVKYKKIPSLSIQYSLKHNTNYHWSTIILKILQPIKYENVFWIYTSSKVVSTSLLVNCNNLFKLFFSYYLYRDFDLSFIFYQSSDKQVYLKIVTVALYNHSQLWVDIPKCTIATFILFKEYDFLL